MMEKLFYGVSVLENYQGIKDVTFYWLHKERGEWTVPWENIKPSIANTQRDYVEIARRFVFQLFTESEITQLKEFVELKPGVKLEAVEVPLPISNVPLWVHSYVDPFSSYDEYKLDHEIGYSLPFPVSACYETPSKETELASKHANAVVENSYSDDPWFNPNIPF